jgi:hypothetical protein
MYRNQYFISKKQISNNSHLNKSTFNNLIIYSHPSLEIVKVNNSLTGVLLLGYIIDPLNPDHRSDDIVNRLAENCKTKESFFKEIQLLSGRFVLLYKNDTNFLAMGDTCALRNLYYSFIDDDTTLTSSPKMFLDLYKIELVISDLKQELISMKEYIDSERYWFGEESFDDRLRKVLPNHYLDITNKKVKRTPIYREELISINDTLEYTATVLKGSLNAIIRRFKVLQPITAGIDTRTLLAASKEFKDNIHYYSFDTSSLKVRPPDSWVPQRLSERLGLCFHLIRPGNLKEEFLTEYKKEHIFPRILPQLPQIQYHYYNYSNKNAVRICGFGGEISRNRAGLTKRRINTSMISHLLFGYQGKSEYLNRAIDTWLEEARPYSEEYNLPLLDLFYWEQQMANWGSQYPFEQDIAIEEFCPWYNKNMLLSVMRTDPKERSMFKSKFHYNLVKHLWPEALAEPINPVGFIGYLKGLTGRKSLLRYYKVKVSSLLRS